MSTTKQSKPSKDAASKPKAPGKPRKQRAISPQLIATHAKLSTFVSGTAVHELAAAMNETGAAISFRLNQLKKRNFAESQGVGRATVWRARGSISDPKQEPSNSAASEAKKPQKPQKQKASLATLDAALRGAKKLRPSGPAVIDGVNTRALLDPEAPDVRVAITDESEVLILNGHTVEQTIPSEIARRLVAFFRKLPNSHPLAVPA